MLRIDSSIVRLILKACVSLVLSALLVATAHGASIDAGLIGAIALGENQAKIDAVTMLGASGDPSALALLEAFKAGEVQTAGERVLQVKNDQATDLVTGQRVTPFPENREDVVLNNRVRREIDTAIAALRLVAADPAVRREAAHTLQNGADDSVLPALKKALEREKEPDIRAALELASARIELGSTDRNTRMHAIQALALSRDPNTRSLLAPLFERRGNEFAEPDAEIRSQAELSLRAIERRLATGEVLARLFTGVSLGSILLLAALGLAITYGLMGVINMAHGELIMIGAYATYVVQNVFRARMPAYFDEYLLVAIPIAFAVSAMVGMVLERVVIRFLYGRPLETLLATWGISLILIQTVRTIFGAQNVQVENPSWMSGGVEVMTNLVLPWNRIMIIGFAAVVVLLVWMLLTRTRLGLFVRGVTQNRGMASALGVPTRRVDTYAFGLGSGIAGLAGCALSQVGNVGPELGQSAIVDSFMVVVLGGVGQLSGTIVAALGLGVANKFLETWSGAVLAKIAVLVFIIVFIQKRPQGLFAVKGRMAEA
ncbi:MAG: urea ABC transporter permease subunit UrtB [Pseudomonadota bacterium]|nr:urea ABC transporter permease subunit UrtB [Pseudomonadota bacterium]